ncbi:MAG: hypothetical protein ABSA47_03355 [Verrucomicrobiota bacterium]
MFVALVGIFYTEEDWRGRRDWNRYRQEMEARGGSLDFRDYIPKPVPAEENFAEAPIIKSWFLNNGSGILNNDLYTRATFIISTTNIADKGHRHFVDLVAWQMAFVALQSAPLNREQYFETDQASLAARAAAAPAVLEGMKPDDADFAAIRLASARTNSRFPLQYDLQDQSQLRLPHLATIKQVCQHLTLQACAELAAGQTDKALADEKLMLYLADSIKSEPFLLSYLLRLSFFQMAIQPVWEGLAERRWTESQLQELEQSFQHYEFPADFDQSLKGEKTYGIHELAQIRKRGLATMDSYTGARLDFSTYSDFKDSVKTVLQRDFLNLIGRIAPAGWYDLERLNYCAIFEAQMKGVMDVAAKVISPSICESNASNMSPQLPELFEKPAGSGLGYFLHHRLIASELEPHLERLYVKAAIAQITADQAALACALERYRLASGQFPETLEALTPRFISRLPNDVIGGQPYKYRRTEDGQFVLYSVGWNEKDDGGVPGKKLFDETEGDWVWDYPAQQ